MTWQEPIVAIIVLFAVVYLYRHIRGMLGLAKPSSSASCHGCDTCDDESESPAAAPSVGTSQRNS